MSKHKLDFEVRNSYYEVNHKDHPELVDNKSAIQFVSLYPDAYMNIIVKQGGKEFHAGSWMPDDIKQMICQLGDFYGMKPTNEMPAASPTKYFFIQDLSADLPYNVYERISDKKLVARFASQKDAIKYVMENK